MIRQTPEEITTVARQIVTGDLLIADLSDFAWQSSLMLILTGMDEDTAAEIGLILVPFAPHAGGFWINGVAPGVTTEAMVIHRDDVDLIAIEVDRMVQALYPDVEPGLHREPPVDQVVNDFAMFHETWEGVERIHWDGPA